MNKKLFLDDVRSVDMIYSSSDSEQFDVVRTYEEFVEYIKTNGLPEFISFDNDLGLDSNGEVAPDGLASAKWLVHESGLDLRKLQFYVHSANPVAKKQIEGLLNNYIKHLNKKPDRTEETLKNSIKSINAYFESLTEEDIKRLKEKYFPDSDIPKGCWINIEDHLPFMRIADMEKGYTEYLIKFEDGTEGSSKVSDHNVWYYEAKEAGVTHWFNK